ncbi:MAG: hypothetical protein HGA97_01050 [Chlorobiaceae bacterium]|nr:hypothetical protein [Chlorobiaceae bacterium]
MVQFSSYVDDNGRGRYTLYTGFGIIVPQLIHTVRRFSSIFQSGLAKMDSDDVFFTWRSFGAS